MTQRDDRTADVAPDPADRSASLTAHVSWCDLPDDHQGDCPDDPARIPANEALFDTRDEYQKLINLVGVDITDQAMLDRLVTAIENLSRDDLEALLFFGVLATRQASILLAAERVA